MSFMVRSLIVVFAFGIVVLAQSTPPRERAETAFNRAKTLPDGAEKEALLKESIGYWKSFEAYYALGKLQMQQRRYAEARENFQNGMAIAADERAVAVSQLEIGLACEAQGNALEGIEYLESALSKVDDPRIRTELKRMRLAAANHTQPAPAIARALTQARAIGTTPKVDLQVNFEFNRADLTPTGKQQAEELGKLLEMIHEPGTQMVFVGHTDEVGSDDYNQKLSLDRAEAVKKYLVERYSVASTQIRTEGHGRKEPLYTGVNDDNNRLNRRVEVKLVSK